ncbi:type I inositol 1, partial [Tropilaelaps mercedesae]
LDTGAVVSWLSEGTELRETKDEAGKLTRQEFHQRTISMTTPTATTVTMKFATSTSASERFSRDGKKRVDSKDTEQKAVDNREITLAHTSRGIDRFSESHQVAQEESKSRANIFSRAELKKSLIQNEPHDNVIEDNIGEEKKGLQEVGNSFCTGIKATAFLPTSGDTSGGGFGVRRVLTLEKKLFELHEEGAKTRFTSDLNRNKLLSHDKEPKFFKEELDEFKIHFPPTYPYSESADDGCSFMGTRCPSWCDRVLFGQKARNSLKMRLIEYDIVGKDHCMGDHK